MTMRGVPPIRCAEQSHRNSRYQDDGKWGQKSVPPGTCLIGRVAGKTPAQAKGSIDEAEADDESDDKANPLP